MCFSLISIAVVASLIHVDSTAAASRFSPDCTLPPEGTSYVSGPNVRGTLMILWNCLSIIFLCTWSILHLNVPVRRPRTESLLKKAYWAILDSRKKVKWMAFTVLVPEYLVGKALNDWISARWRLPDFAELTVQDDTEWEASHGYYANMGGFVLDFTELENPDPGLSGGINSTQITPRRENGTGGDAQASPRDVSKFLKELTSKMLLEDLSLKRVDRINLLRMQHGLWALNIGQLLQARRFGLIDTLPKISAKDLDGLDRGDSLVKAIAILQVLWLIIQLIVRERKNLPSSQLEAAAVAFSASSIITYALYFGRPQGVTNMTRLKAAKLPTEMFLLDYSPSYLWTGQRTEPKSVADLDKAAILISIPNDATNPPALLMGTKIWEAVGGNTESLTLIVGALVGGVVFGGLHCIAWNFEFPSPTESLLWRIASVLTAALPLVSVPFNIYWIKLNGPMQGSYPASKTFRLLVSSVLVGLVAVYVTARLFLVVEMFRSLFSLSPEAFVETWSSGVPHLE